MAKRKGNANGSQNKKHRADNDNSRQMDPLFGMYRALPVSSEVVNSLTEDTVPTDGEIYLAMVRKQAEGGPPVMFIPRAPLDEDLAKEETPEQAIDHELHVLVMDEFKQQREALPEPGVLPIPDDFVFPETFTSWRQYCVTHEPSVELVSNLDQKLAIKLLMYSTRWLAPKTPKEISQWIYCVLCRVCDPLEAGDVAVLRDLGKRAKQLAQREQLPQVTRFTCQLVLHIVAGAFGQRDLLL